MVNVNGGPRFYPAATLGRVNPCVEVIFCGDHAGLHCGNSHERLVPCAWSPGSNRAGITRVRGRGPALDRYGCGMSRLGHDATRLSRHDPRSPWRSAHFSNGRIDSRPSLTRSPHAIQESSLARSRTPRMAIDGGKSEPGQVLVAARSKFSLTNGPDFPLIKIYFSRFSRV